MRRISLPENADKQDRLPLTSMRELPWSDAPVVRDIKPTAFERFDPEKAYVTPATDDSLRYRARFCADQWAALDAEGKPDFYLTDAARDLLYAKPDSTGCAMPTRPHQILVAQAPMEFRQSVSSHAILRAEAGDLIIRSIRPSRDSIWEYFYRVAPSERMHDFEHAPELARDHRLVGQGAYLVTAHDAAGRHPHEKYDFRNERQREAGEVSMSREWF